jgi:hypothetical protein
MTLMAVKLRRSAPAPAAASDSGLDVYFANLSKIRTRAGRPGV